MRTMTARAHVTGGIAAALIFLVFAGCSSLSTMRGQKNYSSMESKFMTAVSADDCAFWHGDKEHLAFVADSGNNAIIVYDAKKRTEIKRFGTKGADKGQLDTPVSVFSADDMLFVLEHGNARIQAFTLPEMESLGFIGDGRLNRPEHMAFYHIELGAFYLYVADSASYEGETLSHIRKFSLSRAVNTIHSQYKMTFGYTDGSGNIRSIDDITVDTAAKQVVVATDAGSKRFTLEGASAGR